MGLSQVIYDVLKTQIQFGVYRLGDTLPTMENASDNFFVALATIRSAYLRLQKEGYITLSQNVGSVVIRNYSGQETEACIQMFFSRRKSALIDLSKSVPLLLGHAQWIGLKNAPVEVFSNMLMFKNNDILQPYYAFNHIMRAYGNLGNSLLDRLLRQIFMFYEAPFFSIPENSCRMSALKEYGPLTLDYCLKQDWEPLQKIIHDAQDFLSQALCRFYEERITAPAPQQETAFTWSAYEKPSQLCYSLAMDLLISIGQGQYAANTLLPSLDKMSKERKVSVSTVRRALTLLNGVGAAKSVRGTGTKVLPFHEMTEHSDFTKPVVRRRLMNLAQSLQLLTLSCRAVARAAVQAMDTDALQEFKRKLSGLKECKKYERMAYAILESVGQHAPYEAIRTVYTELLQQLFWGYSLRMFWIADEGRTELYASFYESFICSLEKADADNCSARLEELMLNELEFTVRHLVQLGISGAGKLLVDEYT